MSRAACLIAILTCACDAAGAHPTSGGSPPPPIAEYSVAQMRHAYGLDALPEQGRGQVIAVATAYGAPTLAHDLGVFDGRFQLPAMSASGASSGACAHPCLLLKPAAPDLRTDDQWALDQLGIVEWTHALAPLADIVLVQARSAAIPDLLDALRLATATGAGVVSISWGRPETPDDQASMSIFAKPGVVFVAGSGDDGHGVNFPAASADVLAVGGTHLVLDSAGGRQAEVGWRGTGGGFSKFTPAPASQLGALPGEHRRSVPDVAYAAMPGVGYTVFDSFDGQPGWTRSGGTSVSAAAWAAIVALLEERRGARLATRDLKARLYQLGENRNVVARTPFADVTAGFNGDCGSECTAVAGYNQVTGLGWPRVDQLLRQF